MRLWFLHRFCFFLYLGFLLAFASLPLFIYCLFSIFPYFFIGNTAGILANSEEFLPENDQNVIYLMKEGLPGILRAAEEHLAAGDDASRDFYSSVVRMYRAALETEEEMPEEPVQTKSRKMVPFEPIVFMATPARVGLVFKSSTR